MYATGIGLLIKGVQKMEYDDVPQQATTSKKKAETKPAEKKPTWLEKLKVYIKDDIPDKEFLQ